MVQLFETPKKAAKIPSQKFITETQNVFLTILSHEDDFYSKPSTENAVLNILSIVLTQKF